MATPKEVLVSSWVEQKNIISKEDGLHMGVHVH